MIELGFYETEEELIHVLNPVILMLDGSTDFSSNEEEKAWNKNSDRKNEKEARYQSSKENTTV